MESLYAIGLGLGLRALIDTVTRSNPRIDGVLIGLWEGAVLNHFLWKFPTSVDPYVGFVFRLFVDFAVTTSFTRLTVVVLWTGIGMVLSDIVPEVYGDKRFRKLTRPFRRWLQRPHLDFAALPSLGSGSRVRFHSDTHTRRRTASVSPSTTPTTRARAPPLPQTRTSQSRRHVPGSYQSETDTTVTNRSATTVRSNTTSPAQIIPPHNDLSPAPRTRHVVSPGPSILSNRSSVRQIVSPTSNIHQILSPPSSGPLSVVESPEPPTQLPLSPPQISPQASSQGLEYVEEPLPPNDPITPDSEPPVSPTEPTNLYPMPLPEPTGESSQHVIQPPLEDIPELGPEEELEEWSPDQDRKCTSPDELDVLKTPPGFTKDDYIYDDPDPLTTPPEVRMRISRIRSSTDRPPSYHLFDGHEYEVPPQIPEIPVQEGADLVQGENFTVPPGDGKQEGTESVRVESVILPPGYPKDESIKLPSEKSTSKKETGNTGKKRADDAVTNYSGGGEKPLPASPLDVHDDDPSVPRSRHGSDSDGVFNPGEQTKEKILEDAQLWREKAREQEKRQAELLNEKKDAERRRIPHKALSLNAKADEAGEEASKSHKRAVERILRANSMDSPPFTLKTEGLGAEEAIQETKKAYQKALEEGATQFRILCATNKKGQAVKRRLTQYLADEHNLSLTSSTNPRELIVPLPNIPSAVTGDPET